MKKLFTILLFITTTNVYAQLSIIYQKGPYLHLRGDLEIKDDSVLEGDQFKLKKDAVVIIKGPNETIKITESSEIKIEKFQKKESIISLIRGEILSRVSGKKYHIKTKVASMGVRGTEFFTTYSDNKTWMCVNKGIVEVKNIKGDKNDVKEGEGIPVIDGKMGKIKSYEWTKKINWDINSKDVILDESAKQELNYLGPLDRSYD